ncbi:hypothetical protein F5Y05DRAFT_421260 [Hypoxylon sp. FL0543]|nr:hypothetical protein F5Y05DRAFT_421260 [Hypoxylon sp. FL0543]
MRMTPEPYAERNLLYRNIQTLLGHLDAQKKLHEHETRLLRSEIKEKDREINSLKEKLRRAEGSQGVLHTDGRETTLLINQSESEVGKKDGFDLDGFELDGTELDGFDLDGFDLDAAQGPAFLHNQESLSMFTQSGDGVDNFPDPNIDLGQGAFSTGDQGNFSMINQDGNGTGSVEEGLDQEALSNLDPNSALVMSNDPVYGSQQPDLSNSFASQYPASPLEDKLLDQAKTPGGLQQQEPASGMVDQVPLVSFSMQPERQGPSEMRYRDPSYSSDDSKAIDTYYPTNTPLVNPSMHEDDLPAESSSAETCVCDLCGSTHKHTAALRRHQNRVHGMKSQGNRHREGAYVCTQCNKTYETASSLRMHRQRIHDPTSAYRVKKATKAKSRGV